MLVPTDEQLRKFLWHEASNCLFDKTRASYVSAIMRHPESKKAAVERWRDAIEAEALQISDVNPVEAIKVTDPKLHQKQHQVLPDNNPKTAHGIKKTPLHLIPPSALIAEAEVFGLGARKYGPYNWRENSVSSSVYQAAALRHLLAWWNGESIDPESGQSHLAHARACLGILIDAESHGSLNDDRPRP